MEEAPNNHDIFFALRVCLVFLEDVAQLELLEKGFGFFLIKLSQPYKNHVQTFITLC